MNSLYIIIYITFTIPDTKAFCPIFCFPVVEMFIYGNKEEEQAGTELVKVQLNLELELGV